MTVKSFFKLVEIQTKVASVIPFILGTLYTLYYHSDVFNPTNFLLMMGSLLAIDMATTAINNYMDYKKANKKEGYGYETHNAIVRDQIKESRVVLTIITLLTLATTFGILLYLNTNVIVLLLGALSFFIGITYSFGPVPISRTPFGEIYSGGFMGLLIPFIAIYIHIHEQGLLNFTYSNEQIQLTIQYLEVGKLLLLSIPLAVGIANIMLANNICDMEDDQVNRRYTLPLYIGKRASLIIFKTLYYIGYIAIVASILLGVLPWITTLSLLTFLIVQKNIRTFDALQSKEKTFVLSVQNFLIMNASLVLLLGISLLVKIIF